MDSLRDEVKDRVSIHCDWPTRVVGKYENRSVVWRILTPPSLPLVIGPGSSYGSEHVAAENPSSNIVKSPSREFIIDARCSSVLAAHFLKGSSWEHPVMQCFPTDSERVLYILIRPCAIAIKGN